MSSRAARRALTAEEAEEAAIAEELAALPDDEEEEVAAPPEPLEQHLRRRPRAVQDDDTGHVQQQAHAEPSIKRLKVEQDIAVASPVQRTPAPAETESGDQVASALKRLTAHISNPAKFTKAAPLLRQLLESGKLTQEHRVLVYEALRAAFPIDAVAAPHLVDPLLRREVMKLAAVAESHATEGYFSRAEKAVILNVWHHLAITRNEMQTDDSFVFSKVLAKVRALVDALPDIEDEVEAAEAYNYVLSGGMGSKPGAQPSKQGTAPGTTAQQQIQPSHDGNNSAGASNNGSVKQSPLAQTQPGQQQRAPGSSSAADEDDDPFGLGAMLGSNPAPKAESAPTSTGGQQRQRQEAGGGASQDDDDPFGLDAMIYQPAPVAPSQPAQAQPPPKKAEPPPASTAWGAAELQAAQRRVALDCVQHARTFHKNAWAQIGIEMLAEHCWQSKQKFAPPQHPELDDLWVWVRKARATRKLGPSAKEVNRDTTSFERARAEWSKATVSHRGKVGAQGDAKSANWLG